MAYRFYTSDYRPEVYTQEGIDWVEHTSMVDVLKRHSPQLHSSLVGIDNASKPWGLNIRGLTQWQCMNRSSGR